MRPRRRFASVLLPALFAAATMLAPPRARAAAVEGARFRFVFHADEIANLVYQLDCMAELMPCSADVYRALWRDQLHWSRDDDDAIRRWGERLRRHMGEGMRATEAEPPPAPYPVIANVPDVGTRLRIASLSAQSVADYASRVELLLDPAPAEELAGLVARFAPRFHPYWETAHPALERFAGASVALLERAQLVPLCERVARFYAAELPDGHAIHFHLIARPRGRSTHTNAQQLENHAPVEVVDGERPEARMDVILHELFHYFLRAVPPARQAKLVTEFAAQPDPAALALYNLLDESLAAALGNGLVVEHIDPKGFAAYLARRRSLYDDDAIDGAARAALDLVRARVAGGGTLYDDFARPYVAAVAKALGAERLRPQIGLRMQIVAWQDGAFAAVRRRLRRAVRADSSWGSAPLSAPDTRALLARWPSVSAVLLLHPRDLARLAGAPSLVDGATLARVTALAASHPRFIYAAPRGDRARLYLLVADDVAGMERLVDRLAARTTPLDGLDADDAR